LLRRRRSNLQLSSNGSVGLPAYLKPRRPSECSHGTTISRSVEMCKQCYDFDDVFSKSRNQIVSSSWFSEIIVSF
jgi:hypothetical protein